MIHYQLHSVKKCLKTFLLPVCILFFLVLALAACVGGTTKSSNNHDDAIDDSGGLTSSPTSDFLSSVTYGNGMFVAVGGDNTIKTSLNGSTWVPATNTTQVDDNLTAVTFAVPIGSWTVNGVAPQPPGGGGYTFGDGGIFVAVGLGGQIYTSLDGNKWLPSENAISNRNTEDLRDIAYGVVIGNGVFVTVGNNGAILFSQDYANSWNDAESSATHEPLFAVTASNLGRFVAVGAHGAVITSDDGNTWTAESSNTSKALYAITYDYATESFVAVGESGAVVTSHDGTSWNVETSGTNDSLTSIGYSYGLLFATTESNAGNVVTSYDGKVWTPKIESNVQSSGKALYSAIGTASGRIATVGESGATFTSDPAMNYTFSQKNLGDITGTLNDVVYVGTNKFIMVGESGIYEYVYTNTSTSGLIFHRYSNPDDHFNAIESGLISGNNNVIAVGDNGVIAKATDASFVTWESQVVGIGASKGLNHIAYASGGMSPGFVAAGDGPNGGIMQYSSDGSSWQAVSNIPGTSGLEGGCPTSKVFGIASNNNYFVTISPYSGYTFASFVSGNKLNTGYNWSCTMSFPSRTNPVVNNMFYGLSQFITVGASGQIFTSPNGVNTPTAQDLAWTQVESSSTAQSLHQGTQVSNTGLISVGDNGTINISDNGVNWYASQESGGAINHLYGVSCGDNNICVAVGESGNIGVAKISPQTINLH